MTDETTIHFIRHGEVHNPDEIYYGRLPGFYLSARGRLQAEATAQALREQRLDAIFTSPIKRAVETAEIIAREQGEVALFPADAILDMTPLQKQTSATDYTNYTDFSLAESV